MPDVSGWAHEVELGRDDDPRERMDRGALDDWVAAETQARRSCHPIDDAYIIAGQGTAGLEIAADLQNVGDRRCGSRPFGGGGLFCGRGYRDQAAPAAGVRALIGVEPENAAEARPHTARKAGKPVASRQG